MTTPSTIIKPTIGRKVWFWPYTSPIPLPASSAQPKCYDPKQAMDATIVFVHSERMVNLLVVDHAGITWPVSSVFLLQEGDATPGGMYAQWMPYQTGQAKKDVQVNAAIGRTMTFGATASIATDATDSAIMPLGLVKTVQIIPARLTPADIEASIASEHYFTAADGVGRVNKGTTSISGKNPECLQQLTFCVLVLRNGAKVVGFNHGSIDPARHDREMGEREARAMALEKVWELEHYLLRQHLQRPAGVLASA